MTIKALFVCMHKVLQLVCKTSQVVNQEGKIIYCCIYSKGTEFKAANAIFLRISL